MNTSPKRDHEPGVDLNAEQIDQVEISRASSRRVLCDFVVQSHTEPHLCEKPRLLGTGMPAHVAKHLSVMTALNKQGQYDRMTDDLFKLTGQKPIGMYDFVKLHAAEFTRAEIGS